ncbi:hypothetical protein J7L48_07805 [bacterium]|nr:hypothetical protein [bacterium]
MKKKILTLILMLAFSINLFSNAYPIEITKKLFSYYPNIEQKITEYLDDIFINGNYKFWCALEEERNKKLKNVDEIVREKYFELHRLILSGDLTRDTYAKLIQIIYNFENPDAIDSIDEMYIKVHKGWKFGLVPDYQKVKSIKMYYLTFSVSNGKINDTSPELLISCEADVSYYDSYRTVHKIKMGFSIKKEKDHLWFSNEMQPFIFSYYYGGVFKLLGEWNRKYYKKHPIDEDEQLSYYSYSARDIKKMKKQLKIKSTLSKH